MTKSESIIIPIDEWWSARLAEEDLQKQNMNINSLELCLALNESAKKDLSNLQQEIKTVSPITFIVGFSSSSAINAYAIQLDQYNYIII